MKITKDYLKRIIKEEMKKVRYTKPEDYKNDSSWKADVEADDYDQGSEDPIIEELEDFQMRIEDGEKVNHKELTNLLFKAAKIDDDFVRRAVEDLQAAVENAPGDMNLGMKRGDKWRR